jgi:hypothetical protein
MVPIRVRHNNILGRLTKAVRFGSVRVDQQVPGTNDECRPDLVIEDGNDVTVIDVTCPFENGKDALMEAETRKTEKYQHLIPHYNTLGKNCKVFGFVIGSLGAWHPRNEEVLNQLKMSVSYRKLFRKLCCSDAIKTSAEIYYDHIKIVEDDA